MHRALADLVLCASRAGTCGGSLQSEELVDAALGDVVFGSLVCERCGSSYLVVDGVLHLIPNVLRPLEMTAATERPPASTQVPVDAYVRSHFSQLDEDEVARRVVECFGTSDLWSVLSWLLSELRPSSVLDLGCAVGGFLSRAAQLSSSLSIGCDLSTELVQQGRQIIANVAPPLAARGTASRDGVASSADRAGVIDIIRADACRVSFRRLFDLVAVINLLDVVEDAANCLANAASHVEAGGHLVVSLAYNWQSQSRVRFADAAALRTSLVGLGFEIVHCDIRIPWIMRDNPRYWRLFLVDVVCARKVEC